MMNRRELLERLRAALAVVSERHECRSDDRFARSQSGGVARTVVTYADLSTGEWGLMVDPRGWLSVICGNPGNAASCWASPAARSRGSAPTAARADESAVFDDQMVLNCSNGWRQLSQ
jgi:hypothetical protein